MYASVHGVPKSPYSLNFSDADILAMPESNSNEHLDAKNFLVSSKLDVALEGSRF